MYPLRTYCTLSRLKRTSEPACQVQAAEFAHSPFTGLNLCCEYGAHISLSSNAEMAVT